VVNLLVGTVSGKRIAVLGFAYRLRPTSSTRPTPTTSRVAAGFSAGVNPAIRICRDLLEEGGQLPIFDPKVSAEQIAADLDREPQAGSAGAGMQSEGVWQPAADPLAAVQGADAVVLLTEWQQFRQLKWPALAAVLPQASAKRLRQPAWLFDARAVADAAAARAAGLRVWVAGEGEG